MQESKEVIVVNCGLVAYRYQLSGLNVAPFPGSEVTFYKCSLCLLPLVGAGQQLQKRKFMFASENNFMDNWGGRMMVIATICVLLLSSAAFARQISGGRTGSPSLRDEVRRYLMDNGLGKTPPMG